MASHKQLIANQSNARKSTGPRTAAGKEKSRYNALRHGLTGAKIVMPGEDPAEYEALLARLMSEFPPQSTIEEHLVDQLAGTLWRLRRVPYLENAFFAWCQQKYWSNDRSLLHAEDIATWAEPEKRETSTDAYLSETWPGQTMKDYRTLKLMGRTVADALACNALNKLSAYETNLVRQLDRLWTQLGKVREQRSALAMIEKSQPDIDAEADTTPIFDEEVLVSLQTEQQGPEFKRVA